MVSRRSFITRSTLAAASTCLLPNALRGDTLAELDARIAAIPLANDPALKALTARALDAATTAGATYADVRLTFHREENRYPAYWRQRFELGIGVRALVNGFWGFASSQVWTLDEASRLGKAAAAQAAYNNWGTTRSVEFVDTLRPVTGTWETPITRDPFAVSYDEKNDMWQEVLSRTAAWIDPQVEIYAYGGGFIWNNFKHQRTTASTLGTFVTQTFHRTEMTGVDGVVGPRVFYRGTEIGTGSGYSLDINEGGGWDKVLDAFRPEQLERQMDAARAKALNPQWQRFKPVDVGRYDVVFDASTMGAMVASVGRALEIDRARGYEANAGGTSFLSPVAETLGTALGPDLLTITGDRSSPTGLATARWDDDGVETGPMTLIDKGAVTGYLTSREHLGELAEWSQKRGIPLRSTGCAMSDSALNIPLVGFPNLTMQPAASTATFEDLIANVSKGIAVRGGSPDMDFQYASGQMDCPVMFEITNGKLGDRIANGGIVFRSREFWKNITAIGGTTSAVTIPIRGPKGQPRQVFLSTMTGVPALVKNLAVIDATSNK